MEGVYHVYVGEVGRRRFICYVDGVAEGKVPDRKGLKFGISRFYAARVVVVYLRQAHSHFSAAGAGSGHDYERTLGLYPVVFAVSLGAYYLFYV